MSASRTSRPGSPRRPDDRPLPWLVARHRATARALAAGAHTRRRAAADGRSARHRRPPVEPTARRQLSGKYVRNNGTPADSRRSRYAEPTERDWDVIERSPASRPSSASARRRVALAWVRSRPAVTSTLIGARTIKQLQSNLASLETTLTTERLAALNEPSTPSLNFPAAVSAELTPTFASAARPSTAFELPVWPPLLESPARY